MLNKSSPVKEAKTPIQYQSPSTSQPNTGWGWAAFFANLYSLPSRYTALSNSCDEALSRSERLIRDAKNDGIHSSSMRNGNTT